MKYTTNTNNTTTTNTKTPAVINTTNSPPQFQSLPQPLPTLFIDCDDTILNFSETIHTLLSSHPQTQSLNHPQVKKKNSSHPPLHDWYFTTARRQLFPHLSSSESLSILHSLFKNPDFYSLASSLHPTPFPDFLTTITDPLITSSYNFRFHTNTNLETLTSKKENLFHYVINPLANTLIYNFSLMFPDHAPLFPSYEINVTPPTKERGELHTDSPSHEEGHKDSSSHGELHTYTLTFRSNLFSPPVTLPKEIKPYNNTKTQISKTQISKTQTTKSQLSKTVLYPPKVSITFHILPPKTEITSKKFLNTLYPNEISSGVHIEDSLHSLSTKTKQKILLTNRNSTDYNAHCGSSLHVDCPKYDIDTNQVYIAHDWKEINSLLKFQARAW